MRHATTRLPRLTAAALWLLAVAWSSSALATDIYVYMDADGSRLITDHPRIEPGYHLVRVYSESKIYREVNALTRPQPATLNPRPSDYDNLIAAVARKTSLDPLLVKSVMHAESAFNPNAVSKRGAVGLMQLMPATAQRYGVSRIFDPRENVRGGAQYLSDLLDLFDGDLKLALAGYNAGEGAVLERGGVPPYGETRRYINKVLSLYRAYQSDRCEQHREEIAAIDGTIISCSASTRNTATGAADTAKQESRPAKQSTSRKAVVSNVTAGNTVSSADEGGWRVVE